MKINVFDFNNLAIRIFFLKMIGGHSPQPDYQLWRFLIFDNIVKSLARNVDTREVILAIDHKNSWRKQFWNGYKRSRKPARDKSGVDWDSFHFELDRYIAELKNHLPFKVIKIRSAEADDIIGVICLKHPDNQYTIISTDEDYAQLCSSNIKVYNPLRKGFLKCNNPEMFIVEKCLLGQRKDDIPNIKTPLDWSVDERRPAFGSTALKKVMEEGYQKWLKKNKLEKRFRENKILIDFREIPKVIQQRVLEEYHKYLMPPPEQLYEFLAKNKFKTYQENFHDLERKMIKLYR